jgi:Ca-activated chloride channel homolog
MRQSATVLWGVTMLLRTASGVPIVQPVATPDTSVVLYVTVTDRDQRVVSDLTREDFEIYDNGKIQTLNSFDARPQPLNVVVMMDTSGSMTRVIDSAAEAADQLLKRLSAADRGLVGSFNDKITFRPAGGFTTDAELLRSGLRQLPLGYPTRLYDALAEAIERLAPTRGRRAIAVLTDGADTASRLQNGEVSKRARATDVAIYGIGIVNSYFNGKEAVHTGPGRDLKNLCADTGGAMAILKDSNEWGPAFARLAEELHSQYAIGFSPQALDRKVHKLDVKLKKPGLTARARKSYVAAVTGG